MSARPIPPIYRCAAGCVGPDGHARKVGNAGALCPVCRPNRIGARPEDVRAAQRLSHTPDPKHAPAHPYPVGSLTPKVGPVDWTALGALAPEGE
jgi:hypothetical protein